MSKTTLDNGRFDIPVELGRLRAFAKSEDLKKIALSKLGAPLGAAIANSLKDPGPFRVRMRLTGPIEIKLTRAELEHLLSAIEIISMRPGSG